MECMNNGTQFRQLAYEDRVRIDALKRSGKGIREIGRALGRSPNTISRELRVKRVRGSYTPRNAQLKTLHKRRLAKRLCLKVATDSRLNALVLEKLALKWSPERIAGYARRHGLLVSKKAIYRALRCFVWVDLKQSQVELTATRTPGLSLVGEPRRHPSMPPCSRPYKDKPFGRPRNWAFLDCRCARRLRAARVGMEGWAPLGARTKGLHDGVGPSRAGQVTHSEQRGGIYRFIYSRFMHHTLMWKGKRPTRKYRVAWIRVRDRLKRPVTERPIARTSGHWEVDFITSWASASVIFVAVDRHTRFTVIKTLPYKKHQLVLNVLEEIKGKYGLASITVDNDIVFNRWRDMQRFLGTRFFFTSPFRAWEKGLVENTNRWIRLFVPKRQAISSVNEETIRAAETFLNETPRQCLGFKTTKEVLLETKLSVGMS